MSHFEKNDERLKEEKRLKKKIEKLKECLREDIGGSTMDLVNDLCKYHEQLGVINYRIELDL